jgi:hypothetical protein
VSKVVIGDQDNKANMADIQAAIETLKPVNFDPLTNAQKIEELRKGLRAALKKIKRELK